jgi:uncharacterized FlaG/YvyC family protein
LIKSKLGEVRTNLIFKWMNIESQNVSLMPAVQRVTATPAPVAAETVSAEVTSRERVSQMVETNAAQTNATRQRIELAERALGVGKSLVIEKDSQRQGYIYKTIDRATGEVVRLWPREEIATALQSLNDTDSRAVMAGMMVDASI